MHSKGLLDQLVHLGELFKRLHKVNMKIHPKKCVFVITLVMYLGHIILPNGIMAHWANVLDGLNFESKSVATPLWAKCEDETHTPKSGTWSLPRLPKIQSLIAGVKTPFIGVFFISMERSWSVDVQNGLAWAIWTFATQVMGKRRAGSQNWQFDSRPLKVGNRPLPDVCRWSAIGH